MKILSVNAGSSSLKFMLFEMPSEEVVVSGAFERIGLSGSFYSVKYNGEKIKKETELSTHKDAVKVLLDELINMNIIASYDEIEGIGHRVLHGGDTYFDSVIVDDAVRSKIRELFPLGPLHNPANLTGIESFMEVLPNTPQVAVFDTAFHQTMDREEYLYACPYEWYTEYGVRKYGFHGTSHKYISQFMKELLNRDAKIINCHIGNGASLCAIKDGKCVDTSMGFTPHAGIVMGTRSGDIDVSLVPYVMEKEGKSANEIMNDLNKKSGFLGISELSSDSRDIEDGIKDGNEKCILAQEMFINSIIKYIAQYYVLLGHVDAICFTAGIGENSVETRLQIVERLSCLGIKIDVEKNNIRGKFAKVNADDSSVELYVIPTNEELMIAKDTMNIINK